MVYSPLPAGSVTYRPSSSFVCYKCRLPKGFPTLLKGPALLPLNRKSHLTYQAARSYVVRSVHASNPLKLYLCIYKGRSMKMIQASRSE